MFINVWSVLIASVVQFIIGAIWYMPLFGNLWGKIHGFDRNSPEAQEAMRKGMMPLLGVQFVVTVITTVVLAIFITWLPMNWNVYALAGFFWIGFVVPTQVSSVIFGGTDPKWMITKIAIMAGAALVELEAAAAIIKIML